MTDGLVRRLAHVADKGLVLLAHVPKADPARGGGRAVGTRHIAIQTTQFLKQYIRHDYCFNTEMGWAVDFEGFWREQKIQTEGVSEMDNLVSEATSSYPERISAHVAVTVASTKRFLSTLVTLERHFVGLFWRFNFMNLSFTTCALRVRRVPPPRVVNIYLGI